MKKKTLIFIIAVIAIIVCKNAYDYGFFSADFAARHLSFVQADPVYASDRDLLANPADHVGEIIKINATILMAEKIDSDSITFVAQTADDATIYFGGTILTDVDIQVGDTMYMEGKILDYQMFMPEEVISMPVALIEVTHASMVQNDDTLSTQSSFPADTSAPIVSDRDILANPADHIGGLIETNVTVKRVEKLSENTITIIAKTLDAAPIAFGCYITKSKTTNINIKPGDKIYLEGKVVDSYTTKESEITFTIAYVDASYTGPAKKEE